MKAQGRGYVRTPFSRRERFIAPFVWAAIIAGLVVAGHFLRWLGVQSDWAYTLPWVGFAVWFLAWVGLVHDKAPPAPSATIARLVLLGFAVIAIVAVASYGAASAVGWRGL